MSAAGAAITMQFLRSAMLSLSYCCLLLFTTGAHSLAVRSSESSDYVARNLATIQKIYDLTIYPHNVPIIKNGESAVPRGLFSDNATGRVTPLGNFTGFRDSIEYFFGLAPVPQTNPAGVAFFKAEMAEFVSGCPEVATSVAYLHTGKVNPTTGGPLPGTKAVPVKQVRSVCCSGFH